MRICAIFITIILFGFSGCISKVEIVAKRHNAMADQEAVLEKIPEEKRAQYFESNRSEYDFLDGKISAYNDLLK